MPIIIKQSSENPYIKSNEYQQIDKTLNFSYNGKKYTKIVYGMDLNPIYRLAVGCLAILCYIPTICCNLKGVSIMWKQAVSGIDKKVVLIENKTKKKEPEAKKEEPKGEDGKKVQFKEVRAREFKKGEATKAVQDMESIELKKFTNSHENTIEPQTRKIPPLSKLQIDTIIEKNGKEQSAHGKPKLFDDHEIVEKLDIVKKVDIGEGVYAYYTKHGKAIIQQQAMRGCTAATAAMLIMDKGGKPDINALRGRNLGEDEDQIQDMEKAGFKPVLSPEVNGLSELRKLIIKGGSAVVSINGAVGNHVIVVDDVSEDLTKVRLRDPCHGWEITVTAKAFMKEWKGGLVAENDKIIQIQ